MDPNHVQQSNATPDDRGHPQSPENIPASTLPRRLNGLPHELDGTGNPYVSYLNSSQIGNNEQQARILHDDDSVSPSSSSRPSAATTRVNSGLGEDPLSIPIANNVASEPDKHVTNVATAELNGPLGDDNGPVANHADPLSKRLGSMMNLLITFGFKTVFTGLFTAFIVVVLINKVVETPGNVFWDASTTNFVVGVLSQISVLLTTTCVRGVFAILGPVLASRKVVKPGGRPGSSFASWVGLSPAACWPSVFQVAAVGAFLNPWCNMRLLLPIAMVGFGSILKYNADFEFYFIRGPAEASMPVYAGLNVPDVGLLRFINSSDLAMYENMWAPSLLGVSLFVKDFSVPDCPSETCRSVFLPGGLTNARLIGPQLNLTLYSVDNFKNSEVITIYNARGFVVKFETPSPTSDSDSLVFDLAEDCVYGGQGIDNGVQLCVKQDGESIIVGWSSCPIELYDRKECNLPNSTWRNDPITSGTRMSLFSQIATTSYDKKNQSILNVETRDSDTPQPVHLSAEDYKEIIAHAMQTTPTSSVMDINNINALDYSVSWMHRTFRKSFQMDNTSTATYLHNFLATPVQFNFVAHIYANYTAAQRGFGGLVDFSLPDDMIALARGGRSASRLAILPWAGWVFIAVDLAIHLGVFVGIVYVLLNGKVVREGEIGVEDLDAVRVANVTEVVLIPGGTRRRWLTRMRHWILGKVVPPKWLAKWTREKEQDMDKLFNREGYKKGEESAMEEGRSLLHLGLDPAAGVSAWRLGRAAPGNMVRLFMR
ncbi:hypothetical protein V8F20_004253 [Naviculisporaceae sp. PSN 640]